MSRKSSNADSCTTPPRIIRSPPRTCGWPTAGAKGFQAYRSSLTGGQPLEALDFRLKSGRDRYRDDDWQQPRYDVKRGVFGDAPLNANAAKFSATMKAVVACAPLYRAHADWKKVRSDLVQPEEFLPIAQRLLDNHAALVAAYRDARAIIGDYPESAGARVLLEMLEIIGEPEVLAKGFLPALKREIAALRRKYFANQPVLFAATASPLLPGPADIRRVKPPARSVKFTAIPSNARERYHDIRSRHANGQDGIVYARGVLTMATAGRGRLLYGADGPIKVWVNGRAVGAQAAATNPIKVDQFSAPVTWRKGRNELLVALRTRRGRVWGFTARGAAEL